MARSKARAELVAAYIDALELKTVPAAPDIWFAKASHAELVGLQCGPAATRDDVVNVAAALGATWQTTAQIDGDAERMIVEIEQRVELLNKSGGLRSLNVSYKNYRQKMISACEPAVTYGQCLTRFKIRIAHLVARNINAGRQPYQGSETILPTISVELEASAPPTPAVRKNTTSRHVERFDDGVKHLTKRKLGTMRILRP